MKGITLPRYLVRERVFNPGQNIVGQRFDLIEFDSTDAAAFHKMSDAFLGKYIKQLLHVLR
jgi:hypothetical protein